MTKEISKNSEKDSLLFEQTKEVLPLSFPQRQIWYLSNLYQDQPVYNETVIIDFGARIHLLFLEIAIEKILQRHQILRTTFTVIKQSPVQVVRKKAFPLFLGVLDFRKDSGEQQEKKFLSFGEKEKKQSFSLETGPLFRFHLIRLRRGDRLLLTVHHTVWDGISCQIFLEELKKNYSDLTSGIKTPFKALPIQYSDFAVWQREWEKKPDCWSEQLSYWKKQLNNPTELPLPGKWMVSEQGSLEGEIFLFSLSPELTERLQEFSKQEGATLFTLLFAAYTILLFRYTDHEDIMSGVVINSRNRPELQGMIGHLLNTLVLRADLSGSPTVTELIGKLKKETSEAFYNQDVPFEKVVEFLNPEHTPGQNPFFRVLFSLAPSFSEVEEETDWHLNQGKFYTGLAKADLFLSIQEKAGGMIGRFEYRTNVFSPSKILHMAEHYNILLEGMLKNPQQKVSTLPLLSPGGKPIFF